MLIERRMCGDGGGRGGRMETTYHTHFSSFYFFDGATE
jgi:hypothetical protein